MWSISFHLVSLDIIEDTSRLPRAVTANLRSSLDLGQSSPIRRVVRDAAHVVPSVPDTEKSY